MAEILQGPPRRSAQVTAADRVRDVAAQRSSRGVICKVGKRRFQLRKQQGWGGVLSPSHRLVVRTGYGSWCLAAAGPSPWQYHPRSAPASLLLSIGIRLYLPKGHLAQGPALGVDIPHIPWSSPETAGPRFQP